MPGNDGRGILDFRGGTGGTDLGVDAVATVLAVILLAVSELLDVERTRDLFSERV